MSVFSIDRRERAAGNARGYLASIVIVPILFAVYWVLTYTKWQPVIVGIISLIALTWAIFVGLHDWIAILLWMGWLLIMVVLAAYYFASGTSMSDGIPVYALGVMLWLIAVEGWASIGMGKYISRTAYKGG